MRMDSRYRSGETLLHGLGWKGLGPNLGNQWENVAKLNEFQCPAIGWEKEA